MRKEERREFGKFARTKGKKKKSRGNLSPNEKKKNLTHHHGIRPREREFVPVPQRHVHARNILDRGTVHPDAVDLEFDVPPDVIGMMVGVQYVRQRPSPPNEFAPVRRGAGRIDCGGLSRRGIVDEISGEGWGGEGGAVWEGCVCDGEDECEIVQNHVNVHIRISHPSLAYDNYRFNRIFDTKMNGRDSDNVGMLCNHTDGGGGGGI